MIQGVVVANNNLRNIPEVVGNDWPLRTPVIHAWSSISLRNKRF
jgi:hypothetical protein